MKRFRATLGATALLVVAVMGCNAITGRPMARYLDDKLLQARVKTRLAAAHPHTLTRVNVDVYNGTVYLIGLIDDEAEALEITRLASLGDRPVVSWLEPRTEAPAASPRSVPPRRQGSGP